MVRLASSTLRTIDRAACPRPRFTHRPRRRQRPSGHRHLQRAVCHTGQDDPRRSPVEPFKRPGGARPMTARALRLSQGTRNSLNTVARAPTSSRSLQIFGPASRRSREALGITRSGHDRNTRATSDRLALWGPTPGTRKSALADFRSSSGSIWVGPQLRPPVRWHPVSGRGCASRSRRAGSLLRCRPSRRRPPARRGLRGWMIA